MVCADNTGCSKAGVWDMSQHCDWTSTEFWVLWWLEPGFVPTR